MNDHFSWSFDWLVFFISNYKTKDQLISYYIIAVCLKRSFAFFHNATLDYGRKNTVSVTIKIQPLLFLFRVMEKLNTTLTFLQKWSGGVISHMIAGFLQRKLCYIRFILLYIWYNEKRFIWHFLETQLKLNFYVKTSAHLLHYYTQWGEKLGKMTSCKPSRDNLFLFLFPIINIYFARERFELSIGIYFPWKYFIWSWQA